MLIYHSNEHQSSSFWQILLRRLAHLTQFNSLFAATRIAQLQTARSNILFGRAAAVELIGACDGFYMATVGENGQPYIQYQ